MNKHRVWGAAVGLGIFFLSTPLVQAQKFHLVIAQAPTAAAQKTVATESLPAGCPNYTGVLSAVGAPVGQPVNLEVFWTRRLRGAITGMFIP